MTTETIFKIVWVLAILQNTIYLIEAKGKFQKREDTSDDLMEIKDTLSLIIGMALLALSSLVTFLTQDRSFVIIWVGVISMTIFLEFLSNMAGPREYKDKKDPAGQ